MKSLEQRMNRFSWACAAVLVMGGFGASGQAMAACEFLEHEPGAPYYWAKMFDFGVVRIEAGHDTPALGEPLTDWVEVGGTLLCSAPISFILRGSAGGDGRQIYNVQVDGKAYATKDAAPPGAPALGVGFITEVEIGSTIYPVSSVGNESFPGPAIGFINVTGQTTFVARRRLVGLGVPVPEGASTPIPSLIPRLLLEDVNGVEKNLIGATANSTVIYQIASCAPTGIDQDVDLGAFSIAARPGVGQPWSKEEDFDFTIACPSSTTPINVHALFTDNATPTNTGSALTLTGASIPTGVELRLFQENDTPITFGPESANPDAQGAFDLFTAPANVETTEQVTFKARLFQTQDTVGEGEINAAARVTLTYD